MKYICRSLGNYFNPVEVTVGKVYDITKEDDNRWCFIDDEGDTRGMRDITDLYYGVWVRCGFSDYLILIKR